MMKGFSLKKRDTRLYADAAAATPIHPKVKKRMVELMALFANPGALHKEATAAKQELEESRQEIAEAIGAHPDEIFFTGSGTEANNLALLGALYPLLREKKDLHAAALSIEHQSVLEPLAHLKKYGLAVTLLPVDEGGIVSPEVLAEAISPQTALISVQLVNSEIGVIEPLREIAKEIRHARKMRTEEGNALPLYFHTDAAQAALYLPLNVEKLGVDMMTLDAQKVLGPKSVGILYRRRGVAIEPIMFGGRQERGFRPGTESAFLAGAFAEALMLAQNGVEERSNRLRGVRDFCIAEIQREIPEAHVNGSLEDRVANNINLSIPGLEGEVAVIALDALGVAISTRSACVTEDEDPSHVLLAIGSSRTSARESIRITLLPDATRSDARRIAGALRQACSLYQNKTRG